MLNYKDIIIILLYTICFTGQTPHESQITKITNHNKKIQKHEKRIFFEQIYQLSLQCDVILPSLR